MKRYNFKILISFLILMSFLIFGVAGCTNNIETRSSEEQSDEVKVHFIDVGQADAILIEQDNQYMLIDAGNNNDSDLLVNYLKEQGVKNLQYMIGTHPHEDHIGGADAVINNFDIDKIFMPKVMNNTKTFEDVIAAINHKNLTITTPVVGDSYKLGDAEWTILGPNSKEYEEINDYSIGIRLVFGNHSFMFMGDAEKISEDEILDNRDANELESEVLKVGHHGSNSSTSEHFLEAVNPRYAVISVGEDNKYGHPHDEIITRLEQKDIEILRTDKRGHIIFSSDGSGNLVYQSDK
jgi:competence protein ComEC